MSLTRYYVSAAGWDQAEEELDLISPQPRSIGIQAARRTYGADGSVYDEAPYIVLEWDVLPTPASYQALLTLFGLSTDLFRQVTVNVPSERLVWRRYNGIAQMPAIGRELTRARFFIRRVQLTLTGLHESS